MVAWEPSRLQGSEDRSGQNSCIVVCFSHHTPRDAGGEEIGEPWEGTVEANLHCMKVLEGWGKVGRGLRHCGYEWDP